MQSVKNFPIKVFVANVRIDVQVQKPFTKNSFDLQTFDTDHFQKLTTTEVFLNVRPQFRKHKVFSFQASCKAL